jgi:hypothetical protein
MKQVVVRRLLLVVVAKVMVVVGNDGGCWYWLLVLVVPMPVELVMMVVVLVLNGWRACQCAKSRRSRKWLRKWQTQSAPSGLCQTHTYTSFVEPPPPPAACNFGLLQEG